MKKILLSAIVLVSMTALTKAQQGRVGINTETPAATLDIVADTSQPTKPDAILIPRLSRAELEAKNDAYGNGTGANNQNGALVFVNAIDGLGTGKTVNVTQTGFYYYDAPNSVWRGLGGATTSSSASVRTSASGNDFTTADLDGYVFLTGGSADLSVIPATAANKGRTITLVRTGTVNVTVTGITASSVNSITVAGRGLAFVSDGTGWQTFSAQ